MWLHCPGVPKGSSRKLHRHRRWQGPYVIVKGIGDTVYRIQHLSNPRQCKVVHYNRLKPHEDSNDNQEDLVVVLEKLNRQQRNIEESEISTEDRSEPGNDQIESSEERQNNQSEGMQQSQLRRSTRVLRSP